MSIRISHPTDRPNFAIVYMPNFDVAFSYETPIAYTAAKYGHWVVRKNTWGATTGKHMNYLDGGNKSSRVSSEEFVDGLNQLLGLRQLANGEMGFV
jgi:hypothetical protein